MLQLDRQHRGKYTRGQSAIAHFLNLEACTMVRTLCSILTSHERYETAATYGPGEG